MLREGLIAEQVTEQRAMLAASELFDREQIEDQAWQLIQDREGRPFVEVPRQEYVDNGRTALMEALTEAGHLSRVEITGNPEEVHQQIMDRLLSGWSALLPEHEQKRRFLEICEELTIKKQQDGILAGWLPEDTELGLISDCPPEELVGNSIGYRFLNRKGMARSSAIRVNHDGTITRIIEQVSRSNSSAISTFSFLADNGIVVERNEQPDLVALGTPFLYRRNDLVDGIVDVQRQLDHWSGVGVIYGDKKTDKPQHVAYERLREESARREDETECYINDLADLEQELAKRKDQGLTQAEALQIYKDEVVRILDAVCMLQPDYAEVTFGKTAAPIFYLAAEMVARGEFAAADSLVQQHSNLKQTITFCGMSISLDQAKELGLPVNSLGELVTKGKEKMKFKTGVCIVKSCDTRPGKTEVGPCSVCKKCQFRFDHNDDPTKDFILFDKPEPQESEEPAKVISLQEKRAQKEAASELVEQGSTIAVAA